MSSVKFSLNEINSFSLVVFHLAVSFSKLMFKKETSWDYLYPKGSPNIMGNISESVYPIFSI